MNYSSDELSRDELTRPRDYDREITLLNVVDHLFSTFIYKILNVYA